MKLPEITLVPNVIRDAAPKEPIDIMSKLVLKDVDGKRNIAQIGDNNGLEPNLAQQIVLSLLDKGLVAIPGFEVQASKSIPAPVAAKAPQETGVATDKKKILEAEVDEFHASIDKKNLYELLDTEPDASRNDLRSKYFALSKRFHPDKAFGDKTGELRRKMEVIFRNLTQAYDILSNPRARADYDSSIADIIEMWAIEKKLKTAIDIASGKIKPPETKEEKQSLKPPAPDKKSISGAPKKTSSPSLGPQRKRGTPISKIPSHPPRPHYEERRREWKRERAGKAMAFILGGHSIAPPSIGKAKLRIREAEIALEHDKFSEAMRLLQEAISIDPENAAAAELLEKAKAGSMEALAKEHISKGLHEQRQGNLPMAIKHFDQAIQTDSDNLDARHLLAEALVQSQKDLPRALTLMKEVISMGGQRARYFATLGDILLMAKDLDKAKEAFEKACALAPENKELKKKLKLCKK